MIFKPIRRFFFRRKLRREIQKIEARIAWKRRLASSLRQHESRVELQQQINKLIKDRDYYEETLDILSSKLVDLLTNSARTGG